MNQKKNSHLRCKHQLDQRKKRWVISLPAKMPESLCLSPKTLSLPFSPCGSWWRAPGKWSSNYTCPGLSPGRPGAGNRALIYCLVFSGVPPKRTVHMPEGSSWKTHRLGSSCEFTNQSCWCTDSRTWKEKKSAQQQSSARYFSYSVEERWLLILVCEQWWCLLLPHDSRNLGLLGDCSAVSHNRHQRH